MVPIFDDCGAIFDKIFHRESRIRGRVEDHLLDSLQLIGDFREGDLLRGALFVLQGNGDKSGLNNRPIVSIAGMRGQDDNLVDFILGTTSVRLRG